MEMWKDGYLIFSIEVRTREVSRAEYNAHPKFENKNNTKHMYIGVEENQTLPHYIIRLEILALFVQDIN